MELIRGEYDRHDQWGKEILGSFLRGRGHEVVIRREDYGVDMFSHSINGAWRWEVEIKRSTKWSNMEDFPYMTVSFLSRKKRLGNFWYCLISEVDPNRLILCHSSVIYSNGSKVEKYIETDSRNGIDGMYHVDKRLCRFETAAERGEI
jgi:hypothetical protein